MLYFIEHVVLKIKNLLFFPQLDMGGTNSILYFGLFEGRNPNPKTDPGYITMYSYLVYYK